MLRNRFVIVVRNLFLIPSVVFFINSGVVLGGAGSIVANGNFEKGYGNNASRNWKDNSRWADLNVKYSRVQDAGRSGYVQKIRCDEFKHGAVQFIQSDVSLEKGDVYKVSFWARGDIHSPLEVLFRKYGKPYTTYHSKAFRLTDEWKKYSYIATINVTDSSAYFMFRFTSNGEVFLDDISVSPVTALSDVPVSPEGNLLANGDFEVGVDKWGIQYRGLSSEHEMPVSAMGLHQYADSTRARRGRFSLKIPAVKTSRFLLTSENMVLSPGVKYSLSFWAFSEVENNFQVAIASGYLGSDIKSSKTVKIGPVWKRYVMSVVAKPSDDNAYFIAISGRGTRSLWLDAVQLEAGEDKSFVNKFPVEIGFNKQKVHPLFIRNEEILLPVNVAAYVTVSDCELRLESVDYYGKKTMLFRDKCNLKAGGRRVINIKHASDKLGYFRLMAEVIINGKVMTSSEYAIGVVPELSDATLAANIMSPFGGHGRFSEAELGAVFRLGVKWLRMHPPLGTKWSVVEKDKGVFNYSDKEVLLAKQVGFQLLGSLDKTPRWASDAPENERRFWSYPPEKMDDWERYVFNIVSHYKGVIDYWEVWNEPDSDGFLKVPGMFDDESKPEVYVALLKRAYHAAKRANPNAVIVGGVATGKPPSRWLAKIFNKGALDYMDVVSFHYYTDGRPGDVLDTPIAVEVKKINDLIKQHTDKKIPIWETESGVMYPETSYIDLQEVSPSYPVPADEAVAYMVRNYVHLLSSGVEKWFYYSMVTSHRIDRREATGFFEWDGAPRPLSIAYAVLSRNLSGLVYSASYEINKSVVAAKFSGKKKDLLVVSAKLWKNNVFHKVSITRNDLYSGYKVLNVMGNDIEFSMNSTSLEFNVSREPVYVIAYKK